MSIPYDTSSLTHVEAFRLHGTLSPRRIEALLDVEHAVTTAATAVTEHVQTAHDGLPCEDFAEDVIYRLALLRDDEDMPDTAAVRVQAIIDALKETQRDIFARAEAATKALRAIEDAVSEWAA